MDSHSRGVTNSSGWLANMISSCTHPLDKAPPPMNRLAKSTFQSPKQSSMLSLSPHIRTPHILRPPCSPSSDQQLRQTTTRRTLSCYLQECYRPSSFFRYSTTVLHLYALDWNIYEKSNWQANPLRLELPPWYYCRGIRHNAIEHIKNRIDYLLKVHSRAYLRRSNGYSQSFFLKTNPATRPNISGKSSSYNSRRASNSTLL